jgi:hypothetical protein
MSRVINQITTITLSDVHTVKLNQHIAQQNSAGWELFNITQQALGIQEYLILLWRKTITDEVKADAK